MSRLDNLPEMSVSELSGALKRTVEDAYGRVRVRGEISGFKRAASGHLYMALKDENAVLDGVCWRGTAGRLATSPEDGLEVVATGRITTYPGRSKYQIVIEEMEVAGEGALLKLLEERRRKLAEEGLFDNERKQALPFLPDVIGVVTSPTGAVIRDILHRLSDRFPRHVLLWPVLVQGDGAAEQVSAAIRGFNAIGENHAPPRPDLLIVARGGGSLEDLWAFNEEIVVRAAAESSIPLISAVGHETDTTLIDFASDRRAPTPTAAAEMAVPVRAELIDHLGEVGRRVHRILDRDLSQRATYLGGLARGLPRPRQSLEAATQRLDDATDRLVGSIPRVLRERSQALAVLSGGLVSPQQKLNQMRERSVELSERLDGAGRALVKRKSERFDDAHAGERIDRAISQLLERQTIQVKGLERQLENLSYQRVLDRGYTVIRDETGRVVSHAGDASPGTLVSIQFQDGGVDAEITGGKKKDRPPAKKQAKKAKGSASPKDAPIDQGSLF